MWECRRALNKHEPHGTNIDGQCIIGKRMVNELSMDYDLMKYQEREKKTLGSPEMVYMEALVIRILIQCTSNSSRQETPGLRCTFELTRQHIIGGEAA